MCALPIHQAPKSNSNLKTIDNTQSAVKSSSLFPKRIVIHQPSAGLNPLVDAAAPIFSLLGRLQRLKTFKNHDKLQQTIIQLINQFQEILKNRHADKEALSVCRYLIAATFDDVISNLPWGYHRWETYALLKLFQQEKQAGEKFFSILQHALQNAQSHLHLLEFIYICLSMGYKGKYRTTEHSQYQLEQITVGLYRQIQSYRGPVLKKLSASAAAANVVQVSPKRSSWLFAALVSACLILVVFISLEYLMDVKLNEAYQRIAKIERTLSQSNQLP